jgi:hypothetical protein
MQMQQLGDARRDAATLCRSGHRNPGASTKAAAVAAGSIVRAVSKIAKRGVMQVPSCPSMY